MKVRTLVEEGVAGSDCGPAWGMREGMKSPLVAPVVILLGGMPICPATEGVLGCGMLVGEGLSVLANPLGS